MIYDVVWLDEAIQELRRSWQAADPAAQAAVDRAVPRINDRLAIAPYTQGETRPPHDARIAFELPVRVLYRVEGARNTVTVLHAAIIRKGQRP